MKDLLVIFVLVLFLSGCNSQEAKPPQPEVTNSSSDSMSMVDRGGYLVNAMGCDDCHSPKRMGPSGPEIIPESRLSGFIAGSKLPPLDPNILKNGWLVFTPDLTAAVGPWGTSFAANISGHATGVGSWTEAQFINSIRKGKLKGQDDARMLLPPMPWQGFAKLSDNDLKAMLAYLKTVPGIENTPPSPIPPGK